MKKYFLYAVLLTVAAIAGSRRDGSAFKSNEAIPPATRLTPAERPAGELKTTATDLRLSSRLPGFMVLE